MKLGVIKGCILSLKKKHPKLEKCPQRKLVLYFPVLDLFVGRMEERGTLP